MAPAFPCAGNCKPLFRLCSRGLPLPHPGNPFARLRRLPVRSHLQARSALRAADPGEEQKKRNWLEQKAVGGGSPSMAVVSIGVPVYNGEKYIAETLDSLLAQSLTDFEIVGSDNASTDSTAEICRSYQKKDSRIRYFRNDRNIGAAPNFNRVVELAAAPLVHCGACDDLYHPRFLESCVEALARDPGLVLS